MNSAAVVPVCLLVGYMLIVANALVCQSPQYLMIGENGLIQCQFPKQFTGIVWYDSPNTDEALVTRLERQENGQLEVSGNGYESGNYDISLNGSLIILSVSSSHDGIFKVVLIDETFKVHKAEVLLVTIVHPSQSTPVVESCGAHNLCLVNPSEGGTLHCMYAGARPPVLLSWTKNRDESNIISNVFTTNTSDGENTYTSLSTLNVSDLIQTTLNVFTCEASGPALNSRETKTSVLVFGLQEERNERTDILRRKVASHSRFEISCTNTKPFAFVWTFEKSNSSSILAIYANGQKSINDSLDVAFDVLLDGTLIIQQASYTSEGIFKCTYLEGNFALSVLVQIVIGDVEMTETQIIVKNSAVWITVTTIVLAGMLIGILCLGTPYVYKRMWIRFVPSTLAGALICAEKISHLILSWPLNNQMSPFAFNEDGIQLLRDVSNEIEKNRRKKNKGVIAGGLASIAGAAITFGAILLPISFGASSGIVFLGTALGAAGAAVNIGSSIKQMIDDSDQRATVEPDLKTFLNFQKQLAVTVHNLAIAYNLIKKGKEFPQFKQTAVNLSVINSLVGIFGKLEAEHHRLALNEKLALASECMTEMLNILEEELREISVYDATFLKDFKEEVQKTQEQPFENMTSCIKTIVTAANTEGGKPTVLTLVIFLFADRKEINADVGKVAMSDVAVTTGKGVDGALNLTSRGVVVGKTVMLKTLDFSDDAIKVTANVTKMAKAVTVAGVILGAVGVAVDVVFVGHAVYDLMKREKGESAQSLLDIADIMEEINHLSSPKSRIL